MKKLNALLNKCFSYSLTCEASVRSDMAKRIMHSILPAIADPAQVATTKGVVDYKSLAAAAEGRHTIIKFGTMACVQEVSHYKDYSKDYYPRAMALIKQGNYEEAIDICIIAFSNYTNWDKAFGGKAWEKIARTIEKLITLDYDLKEIRKDKSNPEYVDKEIEILNDIIIQLNIFDGLAHNTGSIMGKVVKEEVNEYNESNPYFLHDAEGKRYVNPNSWDKDYEHRLVERMMHSKELKNPLHVYKEIEKTLKQHGDDVRYKDWNWKLRGHPDYKADPDEREFNVAKIALHKEAKPYTDALRRDITTLEGLINERELAVRENLMYEIPDAIRVINSRVTSCISLIDFYQSIHRHSNMSVKAFGDMKDTLDVYNKALQQNNASYRTYLSAGESRDIQKMTVILNDYFDTAVKVLHFLEAIE
jgi:hypothetical protein